MMKMRFTILQNGDDKKLYDSKTEKMYDLIDDVPFEINATLEQILRFCPFIDFVGEFNDDRYGIDKRD